MPESSEYASVPTLVGVPLPSKARATLVLTMLLLVISVLVAMIVPGITALVNRPSMTTAVFAGTGANDLLVIRVYNRGGLPSVVEAHAKLQFRATGLAPAALQIVNVDRTEIPANGQADLELNIESVWIYAGSTKETVAEDLCRATGTLQVFVRERDRWGVLRPAGSPLTIELPGRQIRDAVLRRMSGETPKGCVTP